MENYDVIVIGGGPGGYVAAIRCAQLGKKVALVEKEHLGGVCLNWGCIPTKALLKSAEMLHHIKHAQDFGINIAEYKIDIKQMVARSRRVSSQLAAGIKGLLKKNKVTVFEGTAQIAKNKIIEVKNSKEQFSIKASNIIIATGARPKILPGFEPDGKQIWTSREAMIPESLPKSIIIVGSGAIGIEFASFYNALGVDVTILEAQDRILPVEDAEISALAQKIFIQQGIKIFTNVKLLDHKISQNQISVNIQFEEKKHLHTADKLLMAVGISGNIANIGLENTKIKVANSHIVTDEFMQTDEVGIYAIGDVAGSPWLAHKASHEGIIVANMIAGLKPHLINKNNIPGCTYSYPQIASVGLTESAAKAVGYQVRVGKFPYQANGKALALGELNGLIKTIFDAKTGELLGAHMIGAEVTELIQGYVIAKNLEATELDLINTIFPHPTLSEMMHESVLQAYGKAIHI
ncbi:Dihydrolipoyl dehydrogenase [Candidatus Trichorickettsia mobilis]|uniref:Dihydrolipoyl dehydrogenase n=1 Tax=Candidatus Trichorickettsia mobilis TaxID=1346319 RepID=A0ABZ0UWZ2_9RICK|nr:dihydrolipoyl dehydrogenase [Candidatus Trichorickettsia mobilis]WPY01449.1 Dihydrolipoyl dehydrogenase [Candidatus Trichorickettsia mobilis]